MLLCLAPSLPMAQTLADKVTDKEADRLFDSDSVFQIKLTYSPKELRSKSNDSTYMDSWLYYMHPGGKWDSLLAGVRVRGKFRLEHCYFPPAKIKLKKQSIQGTLFRNNRSFKLVTPCRREPGNNDLVLKEYLAYKLFEFLSPVHFKSRLADLNLTKNPLKKSEEHRLAAILVEDFDDLLVRYGGKEVKRLVHPLLQDPLAATRVEFFHYMIGNTDYSSASQHNTKLIDLGAATIPVPFDFDMCGFINAPYAVVSRSSHSDLDIRDVRVRLFRGFRREHTYYQQVRKEYLAAMPAIMKFVDDHSAYFNSPTAYKSSREYLIGFWRILEDDALFSSEILEMARMR